MINLLTDKLTETIKVGKQSIKIHTDFRKWITLETVFLSDVSNEKKMGTLLSLFPKSEHRKITGENIDILVESAMQFFNCGEKMESKKSGGSKPARVYDFNVDQYRIFSDFKHYYNIDLISIEGLHWWIFKQLLFELPDESSFKQVLMFRSVEITSSMSQSQKQYYARMKSKYALKTEKLTASSIGSILGGLSSRKKTQ